MLIIRILTCKMFSLMIDYRQCVQHFPQDLNRLSPINPLDSFAIHFVNLVSLCFRLSVYKWSPVYPALVRRILHWKMAQSKCLNESMLVLSDLELPAMPYIAPITAISRLPEYRLYYAHEIVQWPCGKVICQSQKYTRDHWVMWREAL